MLPLRLVSAMALSAQVGRNKSAGSFESTTQLVVETVVVEDKDGKPIKASRRKISS